MNIASTTARRTPTPRARGSAPAARGTPRRDARRIPILPFVSALALGLLLLPGCGHSHRDYHEGDIWVDNQTHATAVPTNEDLLTFRVAGFQDPFTGDLLGGSPVGEDTARYIGRFDEDYYDAEGDLELGQIIEWFDVFVGDRRDSYFVVE